MRRLAWLVGCIALITLVVWKVDLAPRVDSDFFFSTEDRELKTSQAIDALFPSRPFLILRAAGEVRSAEYQKKIAELSATLAQLPGVASVQSLSQGPTRPEAAFDSPLWQRLLIPKPKTAAAAPEASNLVEPKASNLVEPKASNLIVQLGDGEPASVVAGVEAATAASGLEVVISGVPFVVEQVRRSLLADLKKFSLGAILVFGLVIGLLFRSGSVVAGTLGACLTACTATLGVLGLVGLKLGVLTANLVTIVFVLTLSHAVFLATNWRRLAGERGATAEVVREAVRLTLPASFWCMAATLLTFLSLLFASAKPLRELGLAGAIGTGVALVVAYLFCPPFLEGARVPTAGSLVLGGNRLTSRPAWMLVAVSLLFGFGVLRLVTDPSLLAFFKPSSSLAQGLTTIDADGGSGPLSLVVRDPNGAALDEEPQIVKLRAIHAELEKESAVGTALSVVPLLDEARRASPIAAFLPSKALLTLLSSANYDKVALSFITEDKKSANFFLRMREAGRTEPREVVIERLKAAVAAQGLEAQLVGGLYELQGKLGRLVAGSLLEGLLGLLLIFFFIGAGVSRSGFTGLAMVGALALVPLFLIGLMGLAGMPVDFISSPAAQVAIGIGVDSMIQLAAAARRARQAGLSAADAWLRARGELGGAVVAATLIVALGFALFLLSSFPPTQRFGVAVALGTLMSGAVALYVLPVWAGRGNAGRPLQTSD